MPFCYDGVNDMFESATWDLEAYTEQCQELWGEGIDMKRDFQNFHTNFGLEFYKRSTVTIEYLRVFIRSI